MAAFFARPGPMQTSKISRHGGGLIKFHLARSDVQRPSQRRYKPARALLATHLCKRFFRWQTKDVAHNLEDINATRFFGSDALLSCDHKSEPVTEDCRTSTPPPREFCCAQYQRGVTKILSDLASSAVARLLSVYLSTKPLHPLDSSKSISLNTKKTLE